MPIDVNSGSYARTDEPVDNTVNFTTAHRLRPTAAGEAFDTPIPSVSPKSTAAATFSTAACRIQFNQASGYDATTNASGDLIIQMSGATAANVTRHYVVQFATGGSIRRSRRLRRNVTSVPTMTDNVGLEAAYADHQ